MSTNTIGVNLYSVREHCKTAEDLNETLRKVARIGYPTVQVSGVGPIPPEDIAAMLTEHKLGACATHEKLDALTGDVEQVIHKMKTLGAPFTALGYPGDEWFRPGGAVELADTLKGPAKAITDSGLRFGYHNHEAEFERFADLTFFEEFLKRTEGQPISVELDVHWVVRGGASPARVIREWKHRMGPMHIKDFAVDGRKPVFAEVGAGNMDWDGILAAASEAGIDTYIVEQDTPRTGRDIFDSLAISLENMKKMRLM